MMRRCVNAEIRYFLSNKLFFGVFALLMLIAIFIQRYNLQETRKAYNSYERIYSFYLESGADIEEYLDAGYNVESIKQGDVETVAVDNPLAYHRYMLENMVYVTSDDYVVIQYLEYGIMLFPLIFGTVGIIFATYDIRSKTIKVKAVRYNRLTILASKLIVLVSSTAIFVVITSLLNIIISKILRPIMLKGIDVTEFVVDDFPQSSIILNKIIFVIGISVLYALIGYMMGMVFKKSLIGIIILFTYICVLPLSFTYELKNMYFNIADKLFDFMGTYRINKMLEVGMAESIVLLTFYMIASLAISIFVCKKRSPYV